MWHPAGRMATRIAESKDKSINNIHNKGLYEEADISKLSARKIFRQATNDDYDAIMPLPYPCRPAAPEQVHFTRMVAGSTLNANFSLWGVQVCGGLSATSLPATAE